MLSKKKNKEASLNKFSSEKQAKDLLKKIKKATENLYYISETDSEILPFLGKPVADISKAEIFNQTGIYDNPNFEERDFAQFFERLIKIQNWFGEQEVETARRFAKLKDLLEQNLVNLKVFKIGSIELDIYVVGKTSENILMGIKTKSVET